MNIYPIRNTDGEVTEISIQAKNYKVEPFIQKELLEHEKTLYYERMAFAVEIPTIKKKIIEIFKYN